jgi:hypothetical protein
MFIFIHQDSNVVEMQSLKNILQLLNVIAGLSGKKDLLGEQLSDG